MKKILFIFAAMLLGSMGLWAQTEQPTETGFGIIFSDGSLVKGELYVEGNDTAYVLWDQVIAKEQSFKLYDFGTQTAWVTSQHAYLNEHISIQNDSYVPDSTAAYSIAIGKDSLIIALPGDMPEPNYSGKRGGKKESDDFTVDGYTYILWSGYEYYFRDKQVSVKKISGTIAMVKAYTGYGDFCPPETVTYKGQTYPVAVIMEDMKISNTPREIRIKPSIKCIEYYALVDFSSCAFRFIVEDSETPLFIGPSREFGAPFAGGLYRLKYLNYCYFGRDIINCKPEWNENYGPLAGWKGDNDRHLSVVWGPDVKEPGHHFFYGLPTWEMSLTVEALNPPKIDLDIFCKPYPSENSRPKAMVYAKQKNVYRDRNTWLKNFTIEELPDSATSGGTEWKLYIIGKPGACTGYKMTISPLGNGKMEDKNNASDYGWFTHHKVIHELNIGSGVTHISKLGWDGYPLKIISVHAENVGSLPTMGADAFRGVDKNIPVYAKSTVRPTLEQMDGWKEFKDFRDLDIEEGRGLFKRWMDTITPMDGQCPENIKSLKNKYMNMANSLVRRVDIEALKPDFLKALFQEGDGTLTNPYLIGNAALFVCFAKMTQLVEYSAICGKLTADIDVSDFGTDAVVSGAMARLYTGTFDGNGHSIRVKLQSAKEIGLFGYLAGTVKNLTVDGAVYLTGTADFAGGIVGSCIGNARVLNCVCKATISVTSAVSNGGGLIGKIIPASSAGQSDSVLVQNCAFVGAIQSVGQPASYCAGLVGFTSHRCALKNCYTKATFFNLNPDHCSTLIRYIIDPDPQKITPVRIMNCYYKESLGTLQGTEITNAEWLTSGELCYMLNNSVSDGSQAWYQKIGNDDYPHPFSRGEDTVYRQNESYTNSHTTHTFGPDGFCTVCGAVDPNHQGAYQVSTAGQWKHLAAYVDKDHCKFNVELMKDIDLTGLGNAAFFGKNNVDNAFKGNFDGHGHSLTVNLVSPEDRVGLFLSIDHATIKNLEVEGNITCSNWFIGGIVGTTFNETKIENCISEVTITGTKEGDCSGGGLVGTCVGEGFVMNHCAFTGKMIGKDGKTSCWGGLVGWVNVGVPTITNCYVYATTENISTFSGCTFARVRGNQYQNIKDCYYVTPLGDTQGGIRVSEVDAKRGKMCYDLNKGFTEGAQAWYQMLEGNDPEDYPYPFSQGGDTVYYDKNENKYTNTRPTHHHFVNGFCTECGAIDPNAKEVTISSADQMQRWAGWVNAGHGDVSVKLAMDLDYNRDKLFTIGKDITYTGTFDGQGHKMTMPIGEASAPTLWTNFAGKMRNLYIQWYSSGTKTANEIKNAPSLIENGNNAQFENCSFQFKWDLPENSETDITCRFGLLIGISSSNLKFNNCAFVGMITFIPVQEASVEFGGFFMRSGNGTISNSYEDIFYNMPPRVGVDHNEIIPKIDNHYYSHNNYVYYADGNWREGRRLPDDLANKLGSAVWMWVENDSFFIKHPVPFKQCGIHWNGGEGGEDALPQILTPAQRANKYMENGRIVIQRGNTYYDIFGREL